MWILGRHARQQLQQGHTVRVGDLGTIRVSFKSDGVEDITDFNAGAMIRIRIIFTPSKEFRESVLQGIQFQNAGVLDEGAHYYNLSDYKKAKGITSGGSDDSGGSSIGGGGTGEDGGVDLVNSHLISITNISLFLPVNKLGIVWLEEGTGLFNLIMLQLFHHRIQFWILFYSNNISRILFTGR